MEQVASIKIKDPVFIPNRKRNFFQKWILKYMRDERDLPFITLCLKITFIVIPIGVYLYIPGCFNWWISIVFLLANTTIGLGPYILMLHNTSHRQLFKKEYEWLNYYIPYVLGPFYGESPETYFHHHVIMHHVENNIPPDVSSTMQYRRDSILGFLIYYFEFLFFGIVSLSVYFKRKNRSEFIKKILAGEISFIVFCILMSFINWRATLVVFIIPFVLTRFLMMAGNWAQHAFIDQNDPGNSFLNSITCINSSYNKRCFNDGYHIGHHLRPAMHWTDMPGDFIKNMGQYAEQNSVVFQGIDYFYIWVLLMTKSYGTLAGKFVDLNNRFADRDEIIAFLKSRTQKFPKTVLETI
ncbi:MAG: fatty acid desaturase family protein [Bacteroidia bacterium]